MISVLLYKPRCDLTEILWPLLAAENCNDDHRSNQEQPRTHVTQKTKRGRFVWPSKTQAERRRAISRTILAPDRMEITQPKTEFSLQVWHRLQCFSPTRVKARSSKTTPAPLARILQEHVGTRSEGLWHGHTADWGDKAPSRCGHLQAAGPAVPISPSKTPAWAQLLHGLMNRVHSPGLKLVLRIQVNIKKKHNGTRRKQENLNKIMRDKHRGVGSNCSAAKGKTASKAALRQRAGRPTRSPAQRLASRHQALHDRFLVRVKDLNHIWHPLFLLHSSKINNSTALFDLGGTK